MEKKYYIPIKSVNLSHYMRSGIIAPSKYYENRNPDMQDRFANYILISSNKYTDETNCAIEVAFNSIEESPIKLSKSFLLFDMPLPISRIKAIFFRSEEQKINTEFNITDGAAFIPKSILKVSNEESSGVNELESVSFKQNEIDWKEFLKKYDQTMGGFSVMTIAKEAFQNYPTHYFKALGNINNLFDNFLLNQNVEITNKFRFAFEEQGKLEDFKQIIYNEINESVVQKYAKKDDVKLEIRNAIIQIEKIPDSTLTYLLAILENYGQGKRKQIDSFVSDLLSGKFIDDRKEAITLIFGLNKGYKALRNKYKTANFEANIKFKLNSKLDYYIIESIYQNVFNSLNEIQSFQYIDSLNIKNDSEEIDTANFTTYRVLDKVIILKKKPDFYEELSRSSSENSDKIYSTIIQKVSNWFPKFFKIDSEELRAYLKKELESSMDEYSNYIIQQVKVEFDNKDKALADLSKIISAKDDEINQLKAKHQEIINTESHKTQIERGQKNSGDPVEKASLMYEVAEPFDEILYEQESVTRQKNVIGNLFNEETKVTRKERAKDLKKKNKTPLIDIATNLGIDTENLTVLQLRDEILKSELNNGTVK